MTRQPPAWIDDLPIMEARHYAWMFWAWLETGQRYVRPQPDGVESKLAREIREKLAARATDGLPAAVGSPPGCA